MTEIYEWFLKKAVEPGNTSEDDIPLNTQITYICGRSSENDIVCAGDLVSRKHCLFFRNVNNLFVQDLNSANGIFINGKKQKSQIMVPLEDGDIIGIGINEKISTDLQFVYQVHKQVVIDLEKEHDKMEVQSSNSVRETDHPPNKLLKLTESSESEQKVQNLNLAFSNFQLEDEILKHKIPSALSKEISGTSSSVKMGFKISVGKDYKDPMTNIFVNQMPPTPVSNELEVTLDQAVITENKPGPHECSQSISQAPNSFTGAKIPETVRSSTSLSPINKSANKESSSSEEEVSTTQISIEERPEIQKSQQVDLLKEVEKPKESTQFQMHQQMPDITNAENEKMMSISSGNNTDEEKNEVYKNSNLNISSSEIEWLEKENERFINNSTSPMDPKTCNSNSRQSTSYETNCSMNENQVKINPAWENAFKAISSLNKTTPNLLPNPFPNSQFTYPNYPRSYSNPQNSYPNHYEMVHPNYQYPYPNYYPMENYLNSHQNYPIPYTNWPPSCPSDQVPYVVGQTLCSVPVPVPVPWPNFETPQLNYNKDDLSLPNPCSIEKTREEKSKNVEEFSASLHNTAVEKTDKAGGMKFENTKAKPKIISSEIVNIPYKFSFKQQSPVNNNLTDTVPINKFEPDVKKLGLGFDISADKLFRSCTKSDEALMNIVSWKPAEFESFLSKELPCVLSPDELSKTQLVYKNHEDYCKVLIPLILVNISYQIKNVYKVNKKRTKFTKCKVEPNSASLIWMENKISSFMVGFNIKVYESAQSFQKRLEIGDFLRIIITKGDTNILTLMYGYVAGISNTVKRESDTESVEMTLNIVTKLIDFNIYASKITEVSLLMSLLPSINLVKALDNLKESPLLPMILNPKPEDYKLSPISPDVKGLLETFCTPDLLTKVNFNYKQLSAVRKITDVVIRREPKVALIEGLPGSGKTEVIANTIIEIFNEINGNEEKSRKMKILVCAVYDAELDEILRRLYSKRMYWKNQKTIKMVRVGHLGEMNKLTKAFSLHELARKDVERNLKELDAQNATMSLGKQLDQLRNQQMAMEEEIKTENNRNTVLRHAVISTYLNIKCSGRNVADIYHKEYADLLEVAEHTILSGANVIICRLDMCYLHKMDLAFREENLIPVLMLEEANLSIETDIFKALTFGVQMLILIADAYKQSTQFFNFPVLQDHGFNTSLFKRLKSKLQESPNFPIIKFHVQYRMNKKLAYFPNKFFFQGNVQNEAPSEHFFPLVSYRVFNWNTSNNLQRGEQTFVIALVQCIMRHAELKNDPKPLKIGIITTFQNSKFHIMAEIDEEMKFISEARRNLVSIQVDTLDNFRNQEFDVIFASCYRPKSGQRLEHAQTMYSIITLAKHCLLLYGTFKKFDDETDSLWNCFIDDARERKMFVDIEARPYVSKLKSHILR